MPVPRSLFHIPCDVIVVVIVVVVMFDFKIFK
jgi:hypothetical protein